MNALILNQEFQSFSIVDTYTSFIWTDRYFSCGDFEILSPIEPDTFEKFKIDNYIQIVDSDRTMIIEKITTNTKIEDGSMITISGRSLESILERRIIWGQKMITGNFQDGIEELLNENIINPTDNSRKIENFIFEKSDDPLITELEIQAQYNCDNLYTAIQIICEDRGIGFKVTLNEINQFVFELYAGIDRSYDQTSTPYVLFSPEFDNLINGTYIESRSGTKNVTLIGGEGEGASRKFATVGNEFGLNRREIFTDASDISSDVGNHKILTKEEYEAVLIQRGNESLSDLEDVTGFEGEIESKIMYRYGEDFYEGDIVQIADEFGHNAKVRIIEMIRSNDPTGSSLYPSYMVLPKKGTRIK